MATNDVSSTLASLEEIEAYVGVAADAFRAIEHVAHDLDTGPTLRISTILRALSEQGANRMSAADQEIDKLKHASNGDVEVRGVQHDEQPSAGGLSVDAFLRESNSVLLRDMAGSLRQVSISELVRDDEAVARLPSVDALRIGVEFGMRGRPSSDVLTSVIALSECLEAAETIVDTRRDDGAAALLALLREGLRRSGEISDACRSPTEEVETV